MSTPAEDTATAAALARTLSEIIAPAGFAPGVVVLAGIYLAVAYDVSHGKKDSKESDRLANLHTLLDLAHAQVSKTAKVI